MELHLYGSNPHNKGSEFDPSPKEFKMPKCVTMQCSNDEMTANQREEQYLAGWVGITMYDNICANCFNQLKEER